MNRTKGNFYILSFDEDSVKALNLFYGINHEVNILAYITINPMIDVIDWET